MNKMYIAPDMAIYQYDTVHVLMGSTFDDTKDNQEITPTDEEYNGEFSSRRRGRNPRNNWEDDAYDDFGGDNF